MIIYLVILLVGAFVRRTHHGARMLLRLVDRENDGPVRRLFAYSVASGIFFMFLFVVVLVVTNQMSVSSPLVLSVETTVGQRFAMSDLLPDIKPNIGALRTALCSGTCGDGP